MNFTRCIFICLFMHVCILYRSRPGYSTHVLVGGCLKWWSISLQMESVSEWWRWSYLRSTSVPCKPLCHHGEISFTAVRHECNLRVFWLVVVASEGRLLVRFRWWEVWLHLFDSGFECSLGVKCSLFLVWVWSWKWVLSFSGVVIHHPTSIFWLSTALLQLHRANSSSHAWFT